MQKMWRIKDRKNSSMKTFKQLLKEFPNSKILNAMAPFENSFTFRRSPGAMWDIKNEFYTYIIEFSPKSHDESEAFFKTGLVEKSSFVPTHALDRYVESPEEKSLDDWFMVQNYDPTNLFSEELDEHTTIRFIVDIPFGIFYKDETEKQMAIQQWYKGRLAAQLKAVEDNLEDFNFKVSDTFGEKINYINRAEIEF